MYNTLIMEKYWRQNAAIAHSSIGRSAPLRTIEDSLKDLEGFISSKGSTSLCSAFPQIEVAEDSEMQVSDSDFNYIRSPIPTKMLNFSNGFSNLGTGGNNGGLNEAVITASFTKSHTNDIVRKVNCRKSSAIIPPWIDVPELSRFFVIKSSCLEHVKKSFYNGIWSSTYFGNKRLSEAYCNLNKGAKIFLFFSVNGSGRFCGVAEMISDLENDLDTSIWENNKKYGKAFKVRWIVVRDVHNRSLKHFLIPANDMKPLTNSRDTQEIPPAICKSILKLFKYDQNSIQSFLDNDYV